MENALSLDDIKLPSDALKKKKIKNCGTTDMLWTHGCRVLRCPTYAEFAFCCISLSCPVVSHGAPELQPGQRCRVPVRKTEGVKLCLCTGHVDGTRLPLQSWRLACEGSMYGIQKFKCAPGGTPEMTSTTHGNLRRRP